MPLPRASIAATRTATCSDPASFSTSLARRLSSNPRSARRQNSAASPSDFLSIETSFFLVEGWSMSASMSASAILSAIGTTERSRSPSERNREASLVPDSA